MEDYRKETEWDRKIVWQKIFNECVRNVFQFRITVGKDRIICISNRKWLHSSNKGNTTDVLDSNKQKWKKKNLNIPTKKSSRLRAYVVGFKKDEKENEPKENEYLQNSRIPYIGIVS